MRPNINISNTLQNIRQLPVDIPFSKVEEWVKGEVILKETWPKKYLLKFWFGNNSN